MADFLPAALAQAFGDRLVEPGDRQRLRLDFAGGAAPGAAFEKTFDLVPAGNQEEQATKPGGDVERGGGGEHGLMD